LKAPAFLPMKTAASPSTDCVKSFAGTARGKRTCEGTANGLTEVELGRDGTRGGGVKRDEGVQGELRERDFGLLCERSLDRSGVGLGQRGGFGAESVKSGCAEGGDTAGVV
jgi:hypothetical protein